MSWEGPSAGRGAAGEERSAAAGGDRSAAAAEPRGADRCPLCGEPNECVLARPVGAVAASAGEACGGGEDAPCWCVDRRFPEGLTARATARDGAKSCICRRCLEAAARGGNAGGDAPPDRSC